MGKVVLVTGASSGIGFHTALLLREKGYTVYGVARRVEKMNALREAGIRTGFMDVQDDESIVRVVNEIIDAEGGIDVLVNNAGFGVYGTVEDTPINEARRQFEVNVFGLARVTQLVLPHMRNRRQGIIVNISSVAGKMSMPLGAWYHASKHAIEALSDSLRGEVKPYGIEVVIIEPGIIDTQWWPIAESNLERVSENTTYGKLVSQGEHYLSDPGKMSPPSEVAEVILRAIEAERPETRYRVGEKAKTIVRARDLLPDRAFDMLMKKQLEKSGK